MPSGPTCSPASAASTRITRFDPSQFDSQIAAEVKDFDPLPALPSPKEIRRTDRFAQFAAHAGWQALRDSGLDLDQVNRDEVGVFIGSGIGGLQTVSEQCTVLLERGPDRLSAFMIPMLISNMASGLFSMYHKLRGPNFATCSACATSNHALGEAWRTIKMGDAQIIFAGGAEATIVPIGIGGFCAMKALSTRNDDPGPRLPAVRQGTRRVCHGRGRRRAGARRTGTCEEARRENLL